MESLISNHFFSDTECMLTAINEAKKGEGFVHPNPLVGAVIAKDGKILASGYHHNYGNLHAERDALKNARDNQIDVKGSTIYVTLEPCCHTGKQPPCTQAIIDSGIAKVVIGSRDPNPLVNGKGAELLRKAGIEVVQDFMRAECDALNSIFFHYIQTKTPYVILKYAMTLDGQTATYKGNSQWVSGELSRQNVHLTRANVSAVLTGIGTAVTDDPMLNCRIDDGQVHFQPKRIILDSYVKLPFTSKLAMSAKEIPVIVFCADVLSENEQNRKAALEKMGVQFVQVEESKGKLKLSQVLKKLGEMNIDSVLVESGGKLNASFLFDEGKSFVNEVHLYLAPKFFGNDGTTIMNPVRGLGVEFPADCIEFGKPEVQCFGSDLFLKYKLA